MALLLYLTNSSFAAAQELTVVDFEQFPVTPIANCPVFPYDRGALFSGGTVRQQETDSLNPTKVYRTVQPIFGGFFCYTNPMVISFDEATSDLSFDLYTSNRLITVSDDMGWLRTIDFSFEAEERGNSSSKVRVIVPSSGVRQITIHDPCDYYGPCGAQWLFYVDNVAFKPERPCLAITGVDKLEPNEARRTTNYVNVVVEVTDCRGNALSGISVKTKVSVDQTSGGHRADHPTPIPRPLGGLREDTSTASGAGTEWITLGSNADGAILLQFVPPEVSGTHVIDASCEDVQCYEPDPPFTVKVEVPGLAPIPRFDLFYALTEYLDGTEIGKNIGDNGRHDGMNHWLTPEASEVLWRVAFEYAQLLEFHPDPERLHVNDASLPMGGLFDIHGQWGAPHKSHRKGTVVDIRGNQAPGAVPLTFRADFETAATYAGAEANYEPYAKNPTNNHYHVLLRGD